MWRYVDDARLALDHDGLGFVEGSCDEGNAARGTGLYLITDPLGTCASLSEASAGEDEPGVPVPGWRQLGVAGVEGPVVRQLGCFPSGKVAQVSARNGASQVLRQRHNMRCDRV